MRRAVVALLLVACLGAARANIPSQVGEALAKKAVLVNSAAQAAQDAALSGLSHVNQTVQPVLAAANAAEAAALGALNSGAKTVADKLNQALGLVNSKLAAVQSAATALHNALADGVNPAIKAADAKLNQAVASANMALQGLEDLQGALTGVAVSTVNDHIKFAERTINAALALVNSKVAAIDSVAAPLHNAVTGGVVNPAIKAAEGKVNSALAAVDAARAAAEAAGRQGAALALKLAQEKANATAAVALGAVGLGLSAAQTAQQAVLGNLYDLADGFMAKPLVDASGPFTPGSATGNGYCFPAWSAPNVSLPRPVCPAGYHMSAVGKCVKRTYRVVDVCYTGPVCSAPFNETGAPTCFDDHVKQVIAGLMSLQKQGLALPSTVLPAVLDFANASANVPFQLAKESLELHIGAAAKALGVGKALLSGSGNATNDLLDLGTKLMTFDWPELPDFEQLYNSVSKALKAVPSDVQKDVAAVAPSCIHKCCKQDVALDAGFALPSLGCPAGQKMMDFKCVGDAPLGFQPCPAGFRSCFLSSWHRPLCAVKGDVFGVDSCTLFETLAFAHKLPKVACPAA